MRTESENLTIYKRAILKFGQQSQVNVAIEEMASAIRKLLCPMIEFIKEIWFENFDFYSPPEKKKIYQSECRMKSNVKKYGYKHNYRKRMFCVGGYGNFRRF